MESSRAEFSWGIFLDLLGMGIQAREERQRNFQGPRVAGSRFKVSECSSAAEWENNLYLITILIPFSISHCLAPSAMYTRCHEP